MIAYRAFRNGDPPHLARIWNAQPPLEGRLRAVTPQVIDDHVLSKPYFDRRGLIVAEDEGRVVGFAHAGFGPTADGAQLDRSQGSILALMVQPGGDEQHIARGLLEACENYLVAAGATTLRGGSPIVLNPFYWGLAGGCGVPGVLSNERLVLETLRHAGYTDGRRHRLFSRRLPGFRPPFDRLQMQWHRSLPITVDADHVTATWWEACVLASSECTRSNLGAAARSRQAALRFWDLRPWADGWGERGQGLLEFMCDEAAWSDGLATYTWSETLTQFQQQGVSIVLARTTAEDTRLAGLLTQLGFQETEASIELQKERGAVA